MATPLEVFDELWAIFSYHCAFLHLRTSTRDWHLPSFRNRWRSRVAALPQTAEAAVGPELLAVLGDVVRLFSEGGVKPDIHCFLTSVPGSWDKGDRAASNNPALRAAFSDAVVPAPAGGSPLPLREQWMDHAAALARAGEVRQGGLLRFGMAAVDVGYLQLNAMGGSVNISGFTSDSAPSGGDAYPYASLAGVEASMQEAIPLFRQRGAKGVILDVRFNSGGSDFIGMTVASHFFTERALGFSKRSRLPMAGQHI